MTERCGIRPNIDLIFNTVAPLSSVHIPLFTMGQRGIELLVSHIEGKSELPALTRIPAHLVIRDSCGCSPKQYFICNGYDLI